MYSMRIHFLVSLLALGALMLTASIASAQVMPSDPAGVYSGSFTGAQGRVDVTLDLRPDGTAVVTNNHANRETVTQTGWWTARQSLTTDAVWVYVHLRSVDGRPMRDRMVFQLMGNQLTGIDYSAVTYGPDFTFSRSRPLIGAGPSLAAVTGTVTYRERMALTPNAVVTVRLVDISRADAPGTVISEQIIRNPGQAPIPFTLQYDARSIIPSHTYAVQATIEDGGVTLFRTTRTYPVITQGNPVSLQVMLTRV